MLGSYTWVFTVLWFGSYNGYEDQLSPEKNLKWVKERVVYSLGVWISTNQTISINEN